MLYHLKLFEEMYHRFPQKLNNSTSIFNTDKKKKGLWSENPYINIISEGSSDT